jgi:hypothetical protein
MAYRTRAQALKAYVLWFALGFLILVSTGLIAVTAVAVVIVVLAAVKDAYDHLRGEPLGPWYLDHLPLVVYVLAWAVLKQPYGSLNAIIATLALATAAVDVIQDWVRPPSSRG